jgi:hypothetical protein
MLSMGFQPVQRDENAFPEFVESEALGIGEVV